MPDVRWNLETLEMLAEKHNAPVMVKHALEAVRDQFDALCRHEHQHARQIAATAAREMCEQIPSAATAALRTAVERWLCAGNVSGMPAERETDPDHE